MRPDLNLQGYYTREGLVLGDKGGLGGWEKGRGEGSRDAGMGGGERSWEEAGREAEEEEEEEEEEGNRPKDVPVFVMLPLDTVNAQGVFRYASSPWFSRALDYLAASGVTGVAVDVWWGGVEADPGAYEWSGYRDLFDILKRAGLKMQVVLSFHACGGNVNDITEIPLPKWVHEAGELDPDLFYADKPRDNHPGQRNKECISLFADNAEVLGGRSPLQCYEDFMLSFKSTFLEDLGPFITEIVVGCGPCGELRYPSYVERHGWQFPGVGEFQCYDRRALASLARAAKCVGHPEWGYAGPHNAGTYSELPRETSFFTDGGSWDTPYGQFFLKWYSDSLLEHGNRMLSMARRVFGDVLHNKSDKTTSAPRSGNMLRNIQSWVSKGEVVFPKPSSPSSFTDVCLNSSSTTMSRRTGSSQSFRQSTSPGSMSTAMPSTQSMDMLDVVALLGDRGDAMQDENDTSCPEKFNWSPRILRIGNPVIHDPMRCTVVVDQDGGSSPSSGSDLISFSNTDGAKGAEVDTLGQERVHPPNQWGFFRQIVGVLGGRTHDRPGIDLRIKIAGVHWWYLSRSHGAELTAGYYNTDKQCGYQGVVELCAKHNASLTLTCVEMCDAQHPLEARCSPQGLLRQIWVAAIRNGVELSGENALPLFKQGGPGGNVAAFDRIVHHARNYPDVVGVRPASNWKEQRVVHRPVMTSFTFLRLGEEILCPQNQGLWMRFMHEMQS